MNEGIPLTLHRSRIFSHQPAVFTVRARQPSPPPPYVFARHLLKTWTGRTVEKGLCLLFPGIVVGMQKHVPSGVDGRRHCQGTRAFEYGIAHESVIECPIGVCVRAGGRCTIGDPGYGPPESTGCGVLAAEETG